MNDNHDKFEYSDLIRKYPMAFGKLGYVECGLGWYNIIEKLASGIDNLISKMYCEWLLDIDNENLDHRCDKCSGLQGEHPITGEYPCDNFIFSFPSAVQVKEKFAGLRWYCDFYIDGMEELISAAEDECHRTCENCGSPGTYSNEGWCRIECEICKEFRHGKERYRKEVAAQISLASQAKVTEEETSSSTKS